MVSTRIIAYMVPRWISALYLSGFLLSSLACPHESVQKRALGSENRPEHAIAGQSKDLICNVSEECEVTWQKNGKDFPEVSSQYVYRLRGRELVFISIAVEDSGNYTCYAESCDDPEPETYRLRVDPSQGAVAPVIVQYPNSTCVDREASPGDRVTFCCMFYIGQQTVNSETFTTWYKDGNFSAAMPLDCDNCTDVTTCMSVNVTAESYGNYTVYCSSNFGRTGLDLHLLPAPPHEGKPAWYYPVIGALSAVVIATLLAALVYRLKRVEIQLALKDSFGAKEQNDGKMYDAYISYYWSDTETGPNPDRLYAIDLSQRLGRLGYKVCLAERDFVPGSDISDEISRSLRESRRFILLLSPEFLTYRYLSHETDQCLDIVKKNKKHIIPLFLRNIEKDVIEQRTILNHVVRSHPRLEWRVFENAMPGDPSATNSLSASESGPTIEMGDVAASAHGTAQQLQLQQREERVWKTIRLHMPPLPRRSRGARSSAIDIADESISNNESDRLVVNGEVC